MGKEGVGTLRVLGCVERCDADASMDCVVYLEDEVTALKSGATLRALSSVFSAGPLGQVMSAAQALGASSEVSDLSFYYPLAAPLVQRRLADLESRGCRIAYVVLGFSPGPDVAADFEEVRTSVAHYT